MPYEIREMKVTVGPASVPDADTSAHKPNPHGQAYKEIPTPVDLSGERERMLELNDRLEGKDGRIRLEGGDESSGAASS